jgi:type VI secretion system secreted protein VgrG
MPGKYAIDDYDFTKPKVDLMVKLNRDRPHAYPIDKPEIYDFPGEYLQKSDGTDYVEKRLQELQCQHERAQAFGDARGMCAGYLFTLENYPRDEENKQYLITSVTHSAQVDPIETSSGEGESKFYRCSLELLDSTEPFRPERRTPKPIIQGAHSAVVVGPAGEEIYCNEHGQVKVQFHWDRLGKNDENSSCWLRVANIWAGTEWGGVHIPRIGQEVLVSFMEGDPDQPIITGRVYNATNMPPYELPANKTQSGIKSRSSPGGKASNFNELRFEDKKGKEEVYFQAEKNLNSLVKNSETRKVRNQRTTTIGTQRSSAGDVIEKTTVEADRKTLIKGNDYLNAAEDMGASDGRIVIVHNGDHKLEVLMGSQEMKTFLDHATKSDLGNISRQAVTGKVEDQALQSIEFKVGANSIKIDQMGVTIKGVMVNIEAMAMMNIKGPIVKIN